MQLKSGNLSTLQRQRPAFPLDSNDLRDFFVITAAGDWHICSYQAADRFAEPVFVSADEVVPDEDILYWAMIDDGEYPEPGETERE